MKKLFTDQKFASLIGVQSILFALLFAIWIQPETILIRNLCLIFGALTSVYQIFLNRSYLLSKKAISIWLLLILFAWMSFHLFFLSNDFVLQHIEFLSIWKRGFLGFLFALGFGLVIANTDSKRSRNAWLVFYLGLLAPALIYISKYTLVHFYQARGFIPPEYFQLFTTGSSKFYVAKTAYVGFCIPVFAVALGQIYLLIRKGGLNFYSGFLYFLTLPLVLFIFHVENIKNGFVYAFVLVAIFLTLIIVRYMRAAPVKTFFSASLVVLIVIGIFSKHLQHNDSWKTLWADAQIAVQTSQYENWQCGKKFGYPQNELGLTVIITNYERIAWAINAVKLVREYPLGYGLVEQSFGHRAAILWPNSCLNQSHSGWLDLTLGIGVPGILLILGSLFLSLKNLALVKSDGNIGYQRWRAMLTWTLLSFLLVWCTTEISQKVFLDELIFFLALAGGFIAAQSASSKLNHVIQDGEVRL